MLQAVNRETLVHIDGTPCLKKSQDEKNFKIRIILFLFLQFCSLKMMYVNFTIAHMPCPTQGF